MDGPAAEIASTLTPFVVAVALLSAHNVGGDLAVPDALYVPVNLALAGALLVLARRARVSAEQLGLAREAVPAGVAVGATLAGLVAVVLVMGAALPATRDLLADERVAGIGVGTLAYRTLVRVPLGTVVLEELAFRGVLVGLAQRVWSTWRAVLVSSALFGLWHVLPTLSALRTNDLADEPVARVLAVSGAVLVTFLGGLVFCGLRIWSGSLVAPVLLHVATNSFGTLAAWMVLEAT